MAFDKTQHHSVYLCTIIEESHAALSVNPYPSYIFNPIPLVEGIGIQEGSLCMMPYVLGVPFWGAIGLAALI